MGHTDDVSTPILRPGIKTFKPRRSRITPRQQQALAHAGPCLLTEETLDDAWASGLPVIVDIGFGSGEPVAAMARTFPEQIILAVDVHTPGIGDLLDRCRVEDIDNVFVIEADALELLPALPGPVSGVRTYFPDPWPKSRHHKRRLVQPPVIDAVAERVIEGGFWHLATDWAEYAESICAAFDEHTGWKGGVIPRPDWRPVTHYERRAIREGRAVVDMWFTRI